MDKRIVDIIANFARPGKCSRLIRYVSEPIQQSFLFELLFANALEGDGIALNYEVALRQEAGLKGSSMLGKLRCFPLAGE
jgi:hypothetical protein